MYSLREEKSNSVLRCCYEREEWDTLEIFQEMDTIILLCEKDMHSDISDRDIKMSVSLEKVESCL